MDRRDGRVAAADPTQCLSVCNDRGGLCRDSAEPVGRRWSPALIEIATRLGLGGNFRSDYSVLYPGQLHRQSPLPMKNRLRTLRASKEWSQSDLAEKLSVSRQTVNAIETERYDPSLPLAFKLSRVFKLPIEEIFEPDGQL